MPTPTPAKRSTEPVESAQSLGPALGGAVALTLLAGGIALSMALRAREPKPAPASSSSAPVVVHSAPVATEEIDISDWATSSATAQSSGVPTPSEPGHP